ncbi:MAG: PCRF domain-containing protein, partial [Paramuribaculum sp.]|nr:PCRF domain-containing protein [Paramuribaculum sp.]
MDSPLLERLDGLDLRFEEVSTLLTDPAVLSDQKRYTRLSKEYKDLEKLLGAAGRYRKALEDIAESKEIIATESDEDLRTMAREQLDMLQNAVPSMEEEIKLMLIPADPEDSRPAMLEIRGGTGGDEAALFAGDLLKMYT